MVQKAKDKDVKKREEAESIAELALTYEDIPIAFRVQSHIILGQQNILVILASH